ncbi:MULTISPECIES: SDR family NAD(P)-dependent oxidoreductase [Lactobacillus]|uniref:SDR family NAD(P)-dependent oxidoreductase n=1 Tax=Lactobacillus TaxID=1578 RepID=UPI0024911FC9|nr:MULTISPECIES: SDR family NAD(P)-dependent oxidoreductase [Lactobacillus]
MKLKNKVVLITGSTRGIGKSMALAFAKKGAKVIINGRHPDLDPEFQEALSDLSADYQYLSADLMQSNLKDFAKTAWDLYGKIDILVNNAGINRDKMLIGMRDDDFNQVIDLDLRVPFFLTKAIIKKMNRERSGCIINMASIVGLHGNAGQANYAAAKAGLIGFTKAAPVLSIQLRKQSKLLLKSAILFCLRPQLVVAEKEFVKLLNLKKWLQL